VEFASRAMPGFRNNVVQIEQLPTLSQQYGYTDCFSSYFMFNQELSDYVKNNVESVSGYQGPCHSHFLPLDIDSPAPGKSLETAREIVRYFVDYWGAPEEAVAVYYSGMKGFHLMLATELFGEVEPCVELPGIYREIRQSIVSHAKVTKPDVVDFSISDRLRLLRLPNTRHSKSGLYKVPLKLEEILSYEPEEITNIALKPRSTWLTDESGLMPRNRVDPVPDAVEMYGKCKENAMKKSHSDLPDPGSFLKNGDIFEALCDAELELYREGVPEGSRSSTCLRLASRMRNAGYRQNEASEMIERFANRCIPPLETRIARSIVKSSYQVKGNGYQFGCGSGEGDPPHTQLVYECCPYHGKRIECEKFRQFRSHI